MVELLYSQQKIDYHLMVTAMNNVRVGEEEETANLVDYLKGTSVRL